MATVLVIGSGAREHALAQAFAKSDQVTMVYVAPGNVGMQADKIHPVGIPMTDIDALRDFATMTAIDLTFVGSEEPLIAGIVDDFQAAGLPIFGPTKAAAQLEGSKSFAKDRLVAAGIPTAASVTVTSWPAAERAIMTSEEPVVVKQDGLAAGKGVTIYPTRQAALRAVQELYQGNQQAKLVIEAFLRGVEFSIFSLVGPNGIVHTPVAQDHKRLLDGDLGPNTGGMGAYSPVRWLTDDIVSDAIDRLVEPLLRKMATNNTPFTGVLYTGVMLTADGPKVIEYNVRFGDPETQVVLPQLQSDFYELVHELVNGRQPVVQWQTADVFLGVVLAARGYPVAPEAGAIVPTISMPKIRSFYAGVGQNDDKLITSGGRVVTIVASATSATRAQAQVYAVLDALTTKLQYRHDIGYQAVEKENKVVSGDANRY
ncbi:phosphoribosylamine--glycine ligase [Weissella cibaria]|uniref:phosphoribosylamine--glycine ligase n=1 Tax=Weissella cibaria TaxID=137591 RepID=UPI000BFF92AD|nr:phosphoribosylamine--glycine ligase [Weissella cibaria]